MDAVRAGSVTQQVLRCNLEDRWLPGMSLTTSAGMIQASHRYSPVTIGNGHLYGTAYLQVSRLECRSYPLNENIWRKQHATAVQGAYWSALLLPTKTASWAAKART